MPTRSGPDIELLPESAADDSGFVDDLVILINEAYATSEEGLWNDGAARTSRGEVTDLIRSAQIAAASAGGELVGSVRIQKLDGVTGEFGMLVTSSRARGTGAGRELVAFAEGWVVEQGLSVMQLEVLFPRDWAHPSKEFLRSWYTRLGYISVRSDPFEESFPQLAPRLATACDFVIFHKALTAAPPAVANTATTTGQ